MCYKENGERTKNKIRMNNEKLKQIYYFEQKEVEELVKKFHIKEQMVHLKQVLLVTY